MDISKIDFVIILFITLLSILFFHFFGIRAQKKTDWVLFNQNMR